MAAGCDGLPERPRVGGAEVCEHVLVERDAGLGDDDLVRVRIEVLHGAVELGGVTRFVRRSTLTHVEAQGDYVRLHAADGASHLVRTPLTGLVADWEGAGFVRIHRSIAVNLAHVREVRMQGGRCSVVVPRGEGDIELQVSRRHTPALRDLIHDRSR